MSNDIWERNTEILDFLEKDFFPALYKDMVVLELKPKINNCEKPFSIGEYYIVEIDCQNEILHRYFFSMEYPPQKLMVDKRTWYVYILEVSDGSYYTGVSNDLWNRMSKHKAGKGSKYVRSRLPFELVYLDGFGCKKDALKEEARIKRLKRKAKEKIVSGFNMKGGV